MGRLHVRETAGSVGTWVDSRFVRVERQGCTSYAVSVVAGVLTHHGWIVPRLNKIGQDCTNVRIDFIFYLQETLMQLTRGCRGGRSAIGRGRRQREGKCHRDDGRPDECVAVGDVLGGVYARGLAGLKWRAAGLGCQRCHYEDGRNPKHAMRLGRDCRTAKLNWGKETVLFPGNQMKGRPEKGSTVRLIMKAGEAVYLGQWLSGEHYLGPGVVNSG